MLDNAHILELEDQKEKLEAAVARRKQALRLTENKDFRELIMEFYLKDECARLAHISADPALTELQRADAINMAQAAGHLKRFLSICVRMGESAITDLDDLEDRMADARNEEEHEDFSQNNVHVLDRGDD